MDQNDLIKQSRDTKVDQNIIRLVPRAIDVKSLICYEP